MENMAYYIYGRMRHYYHSYISPTREFQGNEILKNIYIGDINDAYNIVELKEKGITTVISVVSGIYNSYKEDSGIKQIYVEMKDTENEELTGKIENVIELLHNEVKNGEKILIHCICGVSRSVSILIGYLMKYEDYDFEGALYLIRNKRTQANPNVGFIKQLKKYELLQQCHINSDYP